MALQHYYSRILLILLISATASSCNEQAQKNTGDQNKHHITIKKPAADTPKPALKLSIDNIEDTLETEDVGTDFNRHIDPDSNHQEQILTGKQKDADIKLSGKLFTDQEMIDTGDYLHSVDGVQLNIEGNFR